MPFSYSNRVITDARTRITAAVNQKVVTPTMRQVNHPKAHRLIDVTRFAQATKKSNVTLLGNIGLRMINLYFEETVERPSDELG